MGVISKLFCEHPLPLPLGDLTEKEKKRFKKTKWDELEFFTSSFFDIDSGPLDVSIYTISEDGQFYRNNIEFEFTEEKGAKEIDKGIERQDFTGEILFGTEILGEETDYEISFVALIFKGDLKELNINEWKKRSSEKRKKAIAELSARVKEEQAKRKSLWSTITRPFKKVFCFIISMIKWVLFLVFNLVVKIEMWILNK